MKNLLLSSRIKERCKTRGLSVKFLLESCDMNRNTIYDLEKKGSFPTSDKIAKIADYLGCSVDYLLGRTDIMEINNKLLKIDWKKILCAVSKIHNDQEKYASLLEKDCPTYEELKDFADYYSVNLNFFYCDDEKKVNSYSDLIIKGMNCIDEESTPACLHLIKTNKELFAKGTHITDKTTTYQLLHHFVYKTYGCDSKDVDDIFIKRVFNSKNDIEYLFFEFLENYTEAYPKADIDNSLWEKYGKEPNKGNNYSQSILNAAHSGDEFNTKPFTPEQEAYIDKLIEKKKNE